MTLPEIILHSLHSLPPDKQQEVLDFVEFLKQRSPSQVPLKNFEGLWADYNFDISEEDLCAREMSSTTSTFGCDPVWDWL